MILFNLNMGDLLNGIIFPLFYIILHDEVGIKFLYALQPLPKQMGGTILDLLRYLRSSQGLRISPPVDQLNQNGVSRLAREAWLQNRAVL